MILDCEQCLQRGEAQGTRAFSTQATATGTRGTCTGQQPGRIGSDGLRGKALPCGARVLALEGDSQLLEQLVVSLGWGEARARSPEGS